MKAILLTFLLGLVSSAPAANLVIMAVEEPDNYDAVNSMNRFAEQDLRPLGHQVTVVIGDRPVKHHFEGLVEALKDADLLILFSRRRFLPEVQMAAIRAHLDAGKPLLGLRTANHAFIPRPKDSVDPGLTTWPEFSVEVLGAPNTGYETKGLPYTVSVAAGAENSPLLAGVNVANIVGHQSLYQVLPLSADATPLLIGTAHTDASPPMPVAWTRRYGWRQARIFYTSLGAPEDMRIAEVRQLLINGVKWALGK
jgi:type 1 glutamine amidotransferase